MILVLLRTGMRIGELAGQPGQRGHYVPAGQKTQADSEKSPILLMVKPVKVHRRQIE
jgi:hypothetical protein